MGIKLALLFDRKSGVLTALAFGAISLVIFIAGCVVGANVDWYHVAGRLGLLQDAGGAASPPPTAPAGGKTPS